MRGGRKGRREGGIRQRRRMRCLRPRSRRRLPGWGSWVRWKEEEGGEPIISPFTNQPMARTLIPIPNLALRNLIRVYCEEQALPFPTGPAVYNMG